MPIVSTDLVYRLSTTAGSAGDSNSSTPNNSLGKYVATSAMNLAVPLNNLFDDVAGAESAAGDIEYRCVFVLNNHGSLTAQNGKVWLRHTRFAATGADDVFQAKDDAGSNTTHTFNDGDAVRVAAEFGTDTLPAGINNTTTYFIRDANQGAGTFKLAASAGGAAINITADGTGNIRPRHTLIEIGLDPAGVTAKGSAAAQAATIANESTAPAGVSFSEPTTEAGGLAPANVGAGEVFAIWVKRTVTAGTAAKNTDGPDLFFRCETAA